MTQKPGSETDLLEGLSDELGITKPEPAPPPSLREVMRALRFLRFLVMTNTALLVAALIILLSRPS